MGLVDIKDYHRAAILTQLKEWFNSTPRTLWCDIEQTLIPFNTLECLLLLDVWRPLPINKLPLTIQASVLAWRDLCNIPTPKPNQKDIPIPIAILSHAIPNLNIKDWHDKGIKTVADLHRDNFLIPFHMLKNQYNLCSTEQYKYNQI